MVSGNYFNIPDIDWYKQRLTLFMVALMAVFFVLLIRLVYLQIIEGEELRRLSENNCIRLQTIPPSRGLIFDRNGDLLVDNRPSYDLYITLKDTKNLKKTIANLSVYTQFPENDLMAKIIAAKGVPSYKPILLLRDMDRDVFAAVEAHRYELPGITVNIEPIRHYLSDKFASHLIGYLGEISLDELSSGKYKGLRSGDYVGKFGVEKSLENYLRGEPGGRQVEVNAAGQVIRVLQTVDSKPGYNVYLTIDKKLQEEAEALLSGKVGAAIAMDPTNGDILAMASSPSFGKNEFVCGLSHETWNVLMTNPDRPMENKAIQGEYPPASTYKMVTAMAGLEEDVIDQDTVIFCDGKYKFGDRVFRDWKKWGHGSMNVESALAQSCDVFFYQVGQKVGVDRLAKYAGAGGLGQTTGIDIGHENKGLVPTAAWKKRKTGVAWQGGETLSVAIGQGYNLTTPLQVLVLTSAVSNGGIRYRPVIFKKIVSPEGELIRKSNIEVAGTLSVSKHNLDIIKQGLFKAVNEKFGTAFASRIEGIQMSGKTGTAQVVGRSDDEKNDGKSPKKSFLPHAWFTAYAPSDDPKIAVTVIVEHGEHGSSAAAPIAAQMIRTYLTNDEPDETILEVKSHAQ